MSVDEKVLDRVKKLLALSQNNNSPEEAALAARRAQELMLQHSIAMAEVEGEDPIEPQERIVVEYFDSGAKTNQTWRATLWGGICWGNGCQPLVGARLIAIGRESNVQACAYMYHWLTKEIDRLCKDALRDYDGYESARRFSSGFRIGAARTIHNRLVQQREAMFAAAPQSTALVRVRDDKHAVEAAFKKAFPKTETSRGYTGASADGLTEGRKAGARVRLGGGRQLNSAQKQLKGD